MKTLISIICIISLSSFPSFGNQYNTVEKDGKIGLADENGKILIPYEYDDLGWSKGILMPVNGTIGYRLNNLWGLISLENITISKAQYKSLYPALDNYLIASKKGRFSNNSFYGIIDHKAKVHVPFHYEKLIPNNDLLIAAYKNKREISFGIINFKNKIVLPFNYYLLQHVNEHYLLATMNIGEKYLIDFSGKKVLPFSVLGVKEISNQYAIISTNSGYGLIDKTARIILPANFKKLEPNSDGTLNALAFHNWSLVEGVNNNLDHFNADIAQLINEDWICLSRNNHLTLKKLDNTDSISFQGKLNGHNQRVLAVKNQTISLYDVKEKLFLSGKYDSVFFQNELIIMGELINNKWKWKIANSQGEAINKSKYDHLVFEDKYILYRLDDKWGSLNYQFNEVLDPIYDHIRHLENDYFLVNYQKSHGLIQAENSWQILPEMMEINPTDSGYFLAVNRQLENIIYHGKDESYKSPHRIKYATKQIYIESDHDGKTRVIDPNGKAIVDWTKQKISTQDQEIIIIHGEDKNRVINPFKKWDFELDTKTEVVAQSSEAYMMIKKDGKYGFIDHLGNLRIANRYDSAHSFFQDRAAVKIIGRWGFVDHSEQLLIQPQYQSVGDFENGQAFVENFDNKFGVIDLDGNEIIETNYNQIQKINGVGFILYQGNKKGLAGKNGEILLTCKYEELIPDMNGYVRIKRNGLYGLITIKGINTIPIEYDELVFDVSSGHYLGKKEGNWDIKFKTDLKKYP